MTNCFGKTFLYLPFCYMCISGLFELNHKFVQVLFFRQIKFFS